MTQQWIKNAVMSQTKYKSEFDNVQLLAYNFHALVAKIQIFVY